MSIFGQGNACYVLDVAVTDTAAHVSQITTLPGVGKGVQGVSFQLVTTSTLAGAWKIEVSNDAQPTPGLINGQPQTAGTWTDITSAFVPAIAAVLTGGSNQYVQAVPLAARAIRATFTATSGSGQATVIIAGGSL